jgi:hypothetical protein
MERLAAMRFQAAFTININAW